MAQSIDSQWYYNTGGVWRAYQEELTLDAYLTKWNFQEELSPLPGIDSLYSERDGSKLLLVITNNVHHYERIIVFVDSYEYDSATKKWGTALHPVIHLYEPFKLPTPAVERTTRASTNPYGQTSYY